MSKQKQVVWKKMWELLPSRPAILEIGACIGDGVALMLENRPEARIVAVEASPANFARLQLATARGVVCIHAAVGPEDKRTMYIQQEAVSHSCYRGVADHKAQQCTTVDVPGVRLRDIVDKMPGPIDLVRIDCYGGEYDIFPEEVAVLKRVRLLILTMHVKPKPFNKPSYEKRREKIYWSLAQPMKLIAGGKPSAGWGKHIHQLWRNRDASL